jgi:hypothetical protein
MFKRKPLKIYTHQFLHFKAQRLLEPGQNSGRDFKLFSLVVNFCYYTGSLVLWLFKSLANLIFYFFYYIGSACLASVKFAISTSVSEIAKTIKSLHKRYNKILEPQFKNALSIFLVIAIFSSLGFAAMRLVAKGLALKGEVFGIASSGGKNLASAETALKQQDLTLAENKFLQAYRGFSGSQEDLRSTDKLLNQLFGVLPQKRDADKLFSAASLLSRSGADLIEVYKDLSNIRLTAQGINSSVPAAEAFTAANNKISIVKNNLDQASKEIAEINPDNIPQTYRGTFLQMRSQLDILNNSFGSFRDVFDLTQKLIIGNKNVLILFENNNELRASGGFMGTFGNLKLKDGQISKIDISSIYDLDGQLNESIVPPTPVLNVNNRWFLRDSNWFADFPDSARKITSFYEKEGGETPDLIIAMTPDLVSNLLKITGPIVLPDYGVTLNTDNFVEQVQAASTISLSPVNKPKQVLADFFPVLLQKLSELPAGQLPQVLENLQNSLNSKQLVAYSRDPQLEKQLKDFNWSGSVMPSDRDYLLVVNSNLGGTKTDLFIDQDIRLKTSINDKGEIIDELILTRTNRLPKLDKAVNSDFIRIYAPAGSVLLSNTGFDYVDLQANKPQNGMKIDPQVYEWEKSSVRDVVSGTIMGSEAGKSFFGNWLTLNGGETKTVKLTYRLPYKLSDIDRYSLVLQKQLGSLDSKFSWSMDFASRGLEWKNFDTQNLDINSLSYDTILNHDYFLGAVLKKR